MRWPLAFYTASNCGAFFYMGRWFIWGDGLFWGDRSDCLVCGCRRDRLVGITGNLVLGEDFAEQRFDDQHLAGLGGEAAALER